MGLSEVVGFPALDYLGIGSCFAVLDRSGNSVEITGGQPDSFGYALVVAYATDGNGMIVDRINERREKVGGAPLQVSTHLRDVVRKFIALSSADEAGDSLCAGIAVPTSCAGPGLAVDYSSGGSTSPSSLARSGESSWPDLSLGRASGSRCATPSSPYRFPSYLIPKSQTVRQLWFRGWRRRNLRPGRCGYRRFHVQVFQLLAPLRLRPSSVVIGQLDLRRQPESPRACVAVVGGGGLEPPTSAMSRQHSNQLS